MAESVNGESHGAPSTQTTPRSQAPYTHVYQARSASVDLHITPVREGSTLTLKGRLLPRYGSLSARPAILVELLDQLGLVDSRPIAEDGEFEFAGLSCGVYHLRILGSNWKIGIFGLTG